eukprot:CAMPEP_0117535214 /NCGR_PEP_ID=MMETSP0784-20121206/40818_1 /TAXON_ID=39447 /ORGANISM="" /LENGTH=390 /DNA_ID=CAMNT_0005331731 /DNA_START=23 /DNA_END=1195 /DNA_ORIENTATION=-
MSGTADQEVAFDVEAAIIKFLADDSSPELALPHLTTGQRQQAKKVAAQHPELKCESFGFGAERKLHLFKTTSGGAAPTDTVPDVGTSSFSVKNTFIDDFVASEGIDGSSEPVVFRSMPPQLRQSAQQGCFEEAKNAGTTLDFAHVGQTAAGAAEQKPRPTSPDCSTTASVSSLTTGTPEQISRELTDASSKIPTPPGLPLPPGLQVRNTFIHVASTPEDDPRAIQSMPHGMFGECLRAQRLSQQAADAADAASAADAHQPSMPAMPTLAPAAVEPPAVESDLSPGTEVVIEGLWKCPAFNGCGGTVHSFDEATGRYSILLGVAAGGHKWAKVKGENLRAVVPVPPPPFAPTFAPPTPYGEWGYSSPSWPSAQASDDTAKKGQPLSLTALV